MLISVRLRGPEINLASDSSSYRQRTGWNFKFTPGSDVRLGSEGHVIYGDPMAIGIW